MKISFFRDLGGSTKFVRVRLFTRRLTRSFVLLFGAWVLFLGCETQKEKQEAIDGNAAVIDSLRQSLTQAQNETDDLIGTLSLIQDGFAKINEAEGRVNVETLQGEGTERQAIVENMEFITQALQLNRQLIADLRQQLRDASQSSTETKAKLEEMVESLTKQLDAKDEEIETLKAQLAEKSIVIAEQSEQISTLNENVSELQSQNANQAKTVAAQDAELNTAYYAFGTKKELKAQNILSSGEVLRSDNFNKNYFTKIDLRVTKTIKLYSKSAKILTTHPEGSYSLEKDAQKQYVLRISDPKKFWSVSKYLVITVK